MWRLLLYGYQHGYSVVGLTLLFTGLSLVWAREVRFDVSTDSLIDPQSPLLKEYEESRETFGSDRMAAIFAADPDLFQQDRLEKLKELSETLSKLPFAQRVDSLFTLPDIRDVNGILETAPLLRKIPSEPEALNKRKEQATENPLLRRNIISEDGTATLLTVFLEPDSKTEFSSREIYGQIESLLVPYQGGFEEIFQVGGPALESWMTDYIWRDQIRILPISAIILALLLSINLRSAILGLLPVVNAAIASAWFLAAMAVLDIPINFLNYIIPILILVIGATEDVHVLHDYRENLRITRSGLRAIKRTSRHISLALLLTALTTLLGFASTTLSDLPILRQFGISSVIGLTVRFVITIFFLPACLRVLSIWKVTPRARRGFGWRLSRGMSSYIVSRLVPKAVPIVGVLALLTGIALFFAARIQLSNDFLSFLDPESEVVRKIDRVSEDLVGTKVIYLTVHGSPNDFQQPGALRELEAIGDYVREFPEVDSVISFADIVSRIHEQIMEGDPDDYRIPDSAAAVRQLLLVFSSPQDFASYKNLDYSKANIVIRSSFSDSAQLNRFVEEVRASIDSGRFGSFRYSLTGQSVLVAGGVDSITEAQLLSLGTMSFLLFVVISGLFLSLRCGALTVICNLFSIVMIFGIMGLFGISLNVGTCMVAAITLGLAIDDTLHVLVRFNQKVKSFRKERRGIEAALRAEVNPILATSIALAGGFSVLSFSSFGPVREFGILSAGVVIIALFSDLVVTPMFFARTRIVTLWDILGMRLRRALLANSPFFDGLSPWQAKKLILASNVEEYSEGTTVLQRGDVGDKMYVVLSGNLEVTIPRGEEKLSIAKLGLGEVFGEMGFVSKIRRTADITALSKTSLLALDARVKVFWGGSG